MLTLTSHPGSQKWEPGPLLSTVLGASPPHQENMGAVPCASSLCPGRREAGCRGLPAQIPACRLGSRGGTLLSRQGHRLSHSLRCPLTIWAPGPSTASLSCCHDGTGHREVAGCGPPQRLEHRGAAGSSAPPQLEPAGPPPAPERPGAPAVPNRHGRSMEAAPQPQCTCAAGESGESGTSAPGAEAGDGKTLRASPRGCLVLRKDTGLKRWVTEGARGAPWVQHLPSVCVVIPGSRDRVLGGLPASPSALAYSLSKHLNKKMGFGEDRSMI